MMVSRTAMKPTSIAGVAVTISALQGKAVSTMLIALVSIAITACARPLVWMDCKMGPKQMSTVEAIANHATKVLTVLQTTIVMIG